MYGRTTIRSARQLPDFQVRTRIPSGLAQATAARPTAVAAEDAESAALASVTAAAQLAPEFVETRALIAQFALAVQETTTRVPVAETTGTPKRPLLLLAVVAPRATVLQVAPRSRLIASLTDPVTLSV